MTTGYRLFCKVFMFFNTLPCRHMPLLVHFWKYPGGVTSDVQTVSDKTHDLFLPWFWGAALKYSVLVRVLVALQQPMFQKFTTKCSSSCMVCVSLGSCCLLQVNLWNVGCWNHCWIHPTKIPWRRHERRSDCRPTERVTSPSHGFVWLSQKFEWWSNGWPFCQIMIWLAPVIWVECAHLARWE